MLSASFVGFLRFVFIFRNFLVNLVVCMECFTLLVNAGTLTARTIHFWPRAMHLAAD